VKLSAIILAAGASSRMGYPKALLDYHGERFADRLVRIFSAHCLQVILVLGFDAERIRPELQTAPEIVLNPQPERGQLSSLQCGIREVHPSVDAVFFTPVDVPAVAPDTVASLARSFSGQSALAPRHNGKHGHPVLIAARHLSAILEEQASAREAIHRLAVEYIDVDDPGVLKDADNAAAYAELTRGRA
jgi:CTP:molybdopterin cytidylyltransferase MocA